MRKAATAVAVIGLLAGLAACADGGQGEEPPSASPGHYTGRLYVSSEGLDRHDPVAKMGAAGEAITCRTPMTGGFNDPAEGPYDNGATSGTPEGAIEVALGEGGFDGASDGFEQVAADDDRVLFSYEVDGVTKQALIVHDGPTISEDGWYLESWARCDWAEFPDDVIASTPYLIWQDADGQNVSTTEVEATVGPEHCDWQDLTFLHVPGTTYLGGAHGFALRFVEEKPRADIPLPDDAVDSGYSRDGDHLWFAPNESVAYVGSRQSVDTWPRMTEPLLCS